MNLSEKQPHGEQYLRFCAPKNLEEMMEYLHLSVCLKNYKAVLETAGKENLSLQEAFLRLLSLESCAKYERQVLSRINQAKFPQVKTMDTFDFNFPESIPKQKVIAAAELSFIDNAEGLVFIGPTGVGKTHLANAIGYKAAGSGIRTLYTRAVDMINHLIASQADYSLHRAMKHLRTVALYLASAIMQGGALLNAFIAKQISEIARRCRKHRQKNKPSIEILLQVAPSTKGHHPRPQTSLA